YKLFYYKYDMTIFLNRYTLFNHYVLFNRKNKKILLFKPTNKIIHEKFRNLKTGGDILDISHLRRYYIIDIIYLYTDFKQYGYEKINYIFIFSNDKDYFIDKLQWKVLT
ncbi:MAG: hypothetical protein ACP5RZ_06340, partial [Thermoplasmata archaeon]